MKSSCRNHIKKQLETQRLFLDFLCQMGAQNDLKIWVFFALGDHWDTLWLWNDPGGTQEQILLQNTSFCQVFYMIFEWFSNDFWMTILEVMMKQNRLSESWQMTFKIPSKSPELPKRTKTSRCGGVASAFSIINDIRSPCRLAAACQSI